MEDVTNIIPDKNMTLEDERIGVYKMGICEKAALLKHMSNKGLPEESVYGMLVYSCNPNLGAPGLYEIISIFYDLTAYSIKKDADYKKDHADVVKLLEDVPLFIKSISEGKLSKNSGTVRAAIKMFDDYSDHVLRKGMIPD